MVACSGYQPGRQPTTSSHQTRLGGHASAGRTKNAQEKLRPLNQGLILTGSATNFTGFVTSTYIPTYHTEQYAGFLPGRALEVP